MEDRVLTPWKILQTPFRGNGRRKLKLWQSLEHRADGNLPFQAGQGRPQTKVRAKRKGKVPVFLPGNVQAVAKSLFQIQDREPLQLFALSQETEKLIARVNHIICTQQKTRLG